jgi:hypothetical protein
MQPLNHHRLLSATWDIDKASVDPGLTDADRKDLAQARLLIDQVRERSAQGEGADGR